MNFGPGSFARLAGQVPLCAHHAARCLLAVVRLSQQHMVTAISLRVAE
jgi:hypothetical protein